MYRDTHLKINLDHLAHNVYVIQRYCKTATVGAVLKANAYGHGAKTIAKALYNLGIDTFLVSSLIEGIELRQENSSYKIIIIGHTPNIYLKKIVDYNLIPTVFTYEQVAKISNLASCPTKIHLKIETGFNRLGLQINAHTVEIIQRMASLKNIVIEGAFTHLALTNSTEDARQFNKFMNLMKNLEVAGLSIPIQHVCDSISLVLYPAYHLNMVRVGALLYGLESEEKGVLDVKPLLSFHTKCSHIKTLKKGEALSYGGRWHAKKETRIATLPFGYADGYPRNMYQKGHVTIKGRRYPIVGVLCMDQCMVEVNHDVTLADDVHIIDEHITVAEVARLAETNKNDIVSRFTSRVPRVYIKDNQITHVENGLIK